jgi:hypothetical protein
VIFLRTNFRFPGWLLRAVGIFSLLLVSGVAHAGPKQGEGLQTDSLSMLLASHDYTTGTNSSIRNAVNLSLNVGLHYYFVDRVRIGTSLQFTERLWPAPDNGSSRFQRFAVMPQIGWSFYDPFFTALLFSYAPRTQGRAQPDMAVLVALGAAFPITKRMKFSVAAEAPFAFHYHRTLGVVGVMGVGFRL